MEATSIFELLALWKYKIDELDESNNSNCEDCSRL